MVLELYETIVILKRLILEVFRDECHDVCNLLSNAHQSANPQRGQDKSKVAKWLTTDISTRKDIMGVHCTTL